MAARTVRSTRSARVVVTTRDQLVLRAIGFAGFLNTEQVSRDFFPSVGRAQSRLRRLWEAHLVERYTFDSRSPDIYRLTTVGLRELDHGVQPLAAEIVLPKRAPSYAGLRHQEIVGDALLYFLQLVAGTAESELIRWGRGRSSLAKETRLAGFGVVPDAMAVIRSARGEANIAIEVDAATEPMRIVRAKWKNYAKRIGVGAPISELWCVAAGGARRLGAIERTLLEQPFLAGRARLLPAEFIIRRPISVPPTRLGQ